MAQNIYDFTVTKPDGSTQSLADYKGKLLLVVNTATGCGFTPQYEDLERIYREYKAQDFEILDFPCNQFRNQAPGTDEEIRQFCQLKFGADFPQYKKLEVNGDGADPLFVWLATEKPFQGWDKSVKALAMKPFGASIDQEFGEKAYVKWNFTKWLVDREGNIVARFEPTVSMDKVEAAIKAAL